MRGNACTYIGGRMTMDKDQTTGGQKRKIPERAARGIAVASPEDAEEDPEVHCAVRSLVCSAYSQPC